MAKKKQEEQASLMNEMAPPPTAVKLDLPTPHHVSLARVALLERAGTLEGIAKKLDGETYPREARTIRGDAAAITDDLLHQINSQTELPLATDRDVAGAIKDAIRGPVWKHVLASDDESEVDHRAELSEAIGERMAKYVLLVAEKAFNAGLQAREMTPEVICVSALTGLTPSFQ